MQLRRPSLCADRRDHSDGRSDRSGLVVMGSTCVRLFLNLTVRPNAWVRANMRARPEHLKLRPTPGRRCPGLTLGDGLAIPSMP